MEDDPPAKTSAQPATKVAAESPLSLSRLRDAFAAMLGQSPSRIASAKTADASPEIADESARRLATRSCEVNPRTLTEAILFVGRPDNGPLSARELAAAMRGVSPSEIEAAVNELNVAYNRDRTAYRIEQSNGGYRLVLREEFNRMRDKFYGRVKEARLSPAVLEVLSLLAYNQPATAEKLNELRGGPTGAALATLVRRRLVKVDRSEKGEAARYSTSDRFLKLFGLENIEALPRVEEMDKV
jgi:segregation and condensation protein B